MKSYNDLDNIARILPWKTQGKKINFGVFLSYQMEEKVKRREMVSSDACYIFVREISTASANGMSSTSYIERTNASLAEKRPLIAFVQYRFSTEEDIPVLNAYELQIEPRIQGRGLGKYLMQLLELIARKNCMDAVMLTVQKANSRALHFYTNNQVIAKGYCALIGLLYWIINNAIKEDVISTITPSRVDPSVGNIQNYEILFKVFSNEARSILEGGEIGADQGARYRNRKRRH